MTRDTFFFLKVGEAYVSCKRKVRNLRILTVDTNVGEAHVS